MERSNFEIFKDSSFQIFEFLHSRISKFMNSKFMIRSHYLLATVESVKDTYDLSKLERVSLKESR